MAKAYMELKQATRDWFFNEKQPERSVSMMLAKLKRRFPNRHMPKRKTIERWMDDFKVEEKNNKIIKGELGPVEATADEREEAYIQEPELVRRPVDIQLIEPPALEQLEAEGLPTDTALRLLVNWDVAFIKRARIWTDMLQRAVHIFKEFPGIPYRSALALAYLDQSAQFGSEEYWMITAFARRYRPWESKENHKAMQEAVSYWREEESGEPKRRRSILRRSRRDLWEVVNAMWKRDLIKETTR